MQLERARVRGLLELAYWREGRGGVPLLLVHGWPETKRIWGRNVEPLAAAGFEVIVPDLRGFGDSDLAPDGFYDPAAHARDLHALVHDVLGHPSCVAAAGDLGGVVVQDLGLRFPGFVVRQCIFNTLLPLLSDAYAAAGIPPDPPRQLRPASECFLPPANPLRRPGRGARSRGGAGGVRGAVLRVGVRGSSGPVGRGRRPISRRAVSRRGPLPREHRELRAGDGPACRLRAGQVLRAESGADTAAVRTGGPRRGGYVSRQGGGRVSRARRSLCRPRRRTLPAVVACGHLQPFDDVVLSRPGSCVPVTRLGP